MTAPENGMLGDSMLGGLGEASHDFDDSFAEPVRPIETSQELRQFLAEVKGQAQFLLYLTDQIEESLQQLSQESDHCHSAFLCKVLAMYSGQLETKHQGLGEKIAEACQEVYVTIREHEVR
jgi:hypothetical protein